MTDDNDNDSSALETIIDSATTQSTLPLPLSKNILKVFSHLSSALINIPAVYLEGKAERMRAETRGQVKLIETSANQIASQMKIPQEYVRAAANKFGQRVIREQVNLDAICEKAAEDLGDTHTSADVPNSEKLIDDDWLNTFEEEARQKSTEDMQNYFGKLLAGEIKRPGTNSIRAVRILGSLDQNTAKLFRKLCSMVMFYPAGIDARVCSLGGSAGDNSLSKYGLNFFSFNTLNEYGLVISDYNSWVDYQLCILGRIPFQYQGEMWVLEELPGYYNSGEFKVYGVALSSCGRELSHIVNIEPAVEYTQDLISFFQTKNLRMVKIGS